MCFFRIYLKLINVIKEMKWLSLKINSVISKEIGNNKFRSHTGKCIKTIFPNLYKKVQVSNISLIFSRTSESALSAMK